MGYASGHLNGSIQLIDNYYSDGSTNYIIENGKASFMSLREGSFRFGNSSSSGTAGNVAPGINERIRMDTNGLSFNGDTAAANCLDDYEEGTYSPTLSRSSSNVSYSRNYGRYIRIGSMCFVWFDIETSGNNSSGSGSWKVSLPFTFYSNTNGLANAGHGAPSFRDMSFMTRDQGYKTSSYIDGTSIILRTINNSNNEQNMIENGGNGRVTGQAWGYLSSA